MEEGRYRQYCWQLFSNRKRENLPMLPFLSKNKFMHTKQINNDYCTIMMLRMYVNLSGWSKKKHVGIQ